MPATLKPYRYIRRIDNEKNNTHSWHVSIRRANQDVTKHFSDKRYGGLEHALQAAIAFRDKTLKELDTGEYALWKRRLGRHHRNTSGIPGVGRYIQKYKTKQGGIKEMPSWQAFWSDPEGKRHIRSFYISQYGEEGAKQKAIETRHQAMLQLYGQADILTPEDAKKPEEKSLRIRQTLKHSFSPPPSNRTGQIERSSFRRYSSKAQAFIDYPYWRASWKDKNGMEKSQRFTVYRHGEEGALKHALEALATALMPA